MKTSIHNQFLQKAEIRDIQEKKLQELLRYVKNHSPYYQRIFKKQSIGYRTDSTIEGPGFTPHNRQRRPSIVQ